MRKIIRKAFKVQKIKKEKVPSFEEWYGCGEIVANSYVTPTGAHSVLATWDLNDRKKIYNHNCRIPLFHIPARSNKALMLQNMLSDSIWMIQGGNFEEALSLLNEYEKLQKDNKRLYELKYNVSRSDPAYEDILKLIEHNKESIENVKIKWRMAGLITPNRIVNIVPIIDIIANNKTLFRNG